MNLTNHTLETIYHLPTFKDKYSDKELQEFANNLIQNELKSYVEVREDIRLIFQLKGDNYAAFTYSNGQWQKVNYSAPRNNEITGEVIIQNVSVIPKKILINALKEHLGKFKYMDGLKGIESIALTAYRRGMDLHYDIYRITDGVGGSIVSYEDNLNCSGKYSGSGDNDVGNNLLLRSLSREQLPFHGFKISHSLIKTAIETLSMEHYIHLHLWYFPEKAFPQTIEKRQKANYYMFRDYKQSGSNKKYLRAWKALHRALEALILRIIDLQSD
jgi:hypothetical protein